MNEDIRIRSFLLINSFLILILFSCSDSCFICCNDIKGSSAVDINYSEWNIGKGSIAYQNSEGDILLEGSCSNEFISITLTGFLEISNECLLVNTMKLNMCELVENQLQEIHPSSKFTRSDGDLFGETYIAIPGESNYVILRDISSDCKKISGEFSASFEIGNASKVLDPNSPDTLVFRNGRFNIELRD